MPHTQRRLLLAAACLTTCGFAAPVLADANPYYFGGSLSVNQVSNIYRLSNNTNSDTVSTASLLAGMDQRFGRQRVFADGSLNTSRYRSNTDLNNNGYSLKAGLDWSTIERLSGTVSINNSRALGTYNVRDVAPILKQNIEENNQLEAVARLGLVTKFTLEATGGYRTRRFSAVEYARLEFDQNRFSLGVVYRPSTDLTLGVAGRITQDKYPRYSLSGGNYSAGEFERKDIDLTGRWAISGASTLEGRLSSGNSKVIQGVGSDFSGITGLIGWTWQPTARWNLSTNLSRDTGLETSLFSAGTSIFSADQNRLTNALRFNASYEVSSKVALNAGFSLSKTDRTNEFLGQSASNYDRDTLFNLGVRYQLSRGIQLSCQYSKQARDSSTALYVYDASSYGCSGQIILN
jgi:hypothetical protein